MMTNLLLNAVEPDDAFEIGGRFPRVHCEQPIHWQHLLLKYEMKSL